MPIRRPSNCRWDSSLTSECLIHAGLRREELLWLTHDDIDLKTGSFGILRIRAKTIGEESWQPKTKVNRAVPISSTLRRYLDAYRPRIVPRGWYFPSPAGKRYDPDNFSSDLRSANSIAHLSWACLEYRHTFGSHLAMKGESLYKISSLMGNSPEICRRHYAALLLVLRSMIPAQVKVVLLADRGFGRTELARFCQNHGFSYVIRIQPNVQVRAASYSGKLIDYPVHKGICKLLNSAAYRSHHAVTQNIVIRWVRDLPAKRDECWFLMTDLQAGPAQISQLYRQRMTIEELFRDQKNKRNGWSLRDTKITRPERLDRLLLILAIAYLLLCGVGLIALQSGVPGDWSSSTRNECSVFTIGRIMLHRLRTSLATALAAIIAATEEAVPNWG